MRDGLDEKELLDPKGNKWDGNMNRLTKDGENRSCSLKNGLKMGLGRDQDIDVGIENK